MTTYCALRTLTQSPALTPSKVTVVDVSSRTIVLTGAVGLLDVTIPTGTIHLDLQSGKDGKGKEMFYLTTHSTQHILFTVIWRQTYGKEPLS